MNHKCPACNLNGVILEYDDILREKRPKCMLCPWPRAKVVKK